MTKPGSRSAPQPRRGRSRTRTRRSGSQTSSSDRSQKETPAPKAEKKSSLPLPRDAGSRLIREGSPLDAPAAQPITASNQEEQGSAAIAPIPEQRSFPPMAVPRLEDIFEHRFSGLTFQESIYGFFTFCSQNKTK